MSPERCRDVLFCMIELMRKELCDKFYTMKECDDYIFSLLDLEDSEIAEIYAGRGIIYYVSSAFADGTSPKNLHTFYERSSKLRGEKTHKLPPDMCPVCGAWIEDPTGESFDKEDRLIRNWHCDECGSFGNAIYEHGYYEFVEHEIEERGV